DLRAGGALRLQPDVMLARPCGRDACREARDDRRSGGRSPSPSQLGGRDVRGGLEVARRGPPLEPRVAEVDGDSERVEAVHALELVQLDVLDRAGEVAEVLEVLDVAAVLSRLSALRVDDRDLPRLGEAFARAFDDRLVDPLLDDLVCRLLLEKQKEPLLRYSEPARQRRVVQ